MKDQRKGGQVSTASLSSSYQVPALDGRMIQATPLKFCLKYKPPTIAVVYTINASGKKKPAKQRKYIHSIHVDFNQLPSKTPLRDPKPLHTVESLDQMCQQLCEQESAYLNTSIISKQQVFDLLKKLYEKEYGQLASSISSASLPGKNPAASTKESTTISQKPTETAPKGSEKAASAPVDKKVEPKQTKTTAEVKPDPKSKAKNVIEDDYEDDLDWNDDGWGDADFGEVDNKKAASKDAPKADTKPKNEKNRAGYYGQDLQDDFDKPEDKFNKVLSTSKENGGLLASIGLKNKDIANEDGSLDGDSEEAPHNKSDLFDTSKDRIAKKAGAKAKGKESDEDFDLGFSSIKKQADKEPAQETKKAKDDDEPTAEEQRREIEDQFKSLYDNDPELRKALERSDVANFTVEEKYQIIEAYMQSGFNAAELQIELEDDDEKALAEMSEEDIELLNANFAQIYARDPELKAMLPEDISQLTLLQKYQILVHYQRAEEAEGLGTSADGFMSGDDSVIVHEGKMYRRVQIEGKDEEYLIDEKQNIYDLNLNLIGVKGDSDDEDD